MPAGATKAPARSLRRLIPKRLQVEHTPPESRKLDEFGPQQARQQAATKKHEV